MRFKQEYADQIILDKNETSNRVVELLKLRQEKRVKRALAKKIANMMKANRNQIMDQV